mmetsp:Transcript_70777/g.198012  ORF Transcript_70777/g.198012 Transcript_70777/m.198012 type:complete len:550 (-) Transcript_70777:623-2272(-)
MVDKICAFRCFEVVFKLKMKRAQPTTVEYSRRDNDARAIVLKRRTKENNIAWLRGAKNTPENYTPGEAGSASSSSSSSSSSMSVTGQTRKCGLVLEEWLRLEVHKAQTKPFMKSARVDLVYRNNYYGCKEIGEPAPFWYTSPASAKPESRRICVRVQREWKRMIGMEDYVSSPLNDVYRLPVGDARSLLEKAMSKEEFHKINAAIKCLGRPEIAWTYIDGELGNEPQVAYLNKKREATNEALRAIDDRAREKRNAEDEARFLKYRLEYAKNPSSIGAFTLRLSNDKINKIIKRTIVELKDYVAEQQLAHPKTQYMIYVCLSVEETMAFPPPETTNRDFQEKEKKDKFVGSCSREGNDEFKGCFYEPLNAAIYQGGGRACPRVGEELNIALGPRYILDNLDPRWVDIGATHSNLEAQRLESGMQTAVHAAKLLNLHLTPAVKAGNAFNVSKRLQKPSHASPHGTAVSCSVAFSAPAFDRTHAAVNKQKVALCHLKKKTPPLSQCLDYTPAGSCSTMENTLAQDYVLALIRKRQWELPRTRTSHSTSSSLS